MNEALKATVRTRAGNRCEYCRLPQTVLPKATFHVEHIVARQHGGGDDDTNLALACDRRNLFKGPDLTAIDPGSSRVVSLFNPRTHRWSDHFRQAEYEIHGITDVGRATVRLLNMNARRRVELRQALQLRVDVD